MRGSYIAPKVGSLPATHIMDIQKELQTLLPRNKIVSASSWDHNSPGEEIVCFFKTSSQRYTCWSESTTRSELLLRNISFVLLAVFV